MFKCWHAVHDNDFLYRASSWGRRSRHFNENFRSLVDVGPGQGGNMRESVGLGVCLFAPMMRPFGYGLSVAVVIVMIADSQKRKTSSIF